MITGSFSSGDSFIYGEDGGLYPQPPKKYDDTDLELITNNLLDKLHISSKPVLVKCEACGQWAAVQTACKHCGHPVG